MTDIALIPARRGAGKNMTMLADRPLAEYAIRSALSWFKPADIVVSTDCPDVTELAKRYETMVLPRPAELCTPESNIVATILHAAKLLDDASSVTLFQPTSPFVCKEHIKPVLEEDIGKWASVQTCHSTPHQYHMMNQRCIVGAGTVDFWFDERHEMPNKQDKPLVLSFGNLVRMRVGAVREQNTPFPAPSKPVIIDRAFSHDVDTPMDVVLAEALLFHGLVRLPHLEQ
jgi:CMP-N-acetylneuraminic acid synthetase